MDKAKSYKIDLIVGARPNFMKAAALVAAIKKGNRRLTYRLVHTGQHYDKNMSANFFIQLGIPHPDINLEVGSGSQAGQSAEIMVRYEKLLLTSPCDLCIVVGDVNSTMACAIVAKKLNIKVAHVEAGIRSGDITMPEEINRIVTDSISDYFFTTTVDAGANLLKSGHSQEQIFFVGNTMIDTLVASYDKFKQPEFWHKFALVCKQYVVLTLHRPANVDSQSLLLKYLQTICQNVNNMPVIFPAHPRTEATLIGCNEKLPSNLKIVEPQPYLEFNYLVKNAKVVITDSGGITEETTYMKVPCLTLRNSTERPETVKIGTNVLVGTDPLALKPYLEDVLNDRWKNGDIPDKWDGKTSDRIVKILEDLISV